MENASKALLMAAGVLIGVILLTLMAYLFGSFSISTGNVEKEIELGQIQNFNNKFLAYDGQQNLTIYDVLSTVNLAKDNNTNYNLTQQDDYNYYISVDLVVDNNTYTNLEQNDNFNITVEKLKNDEKYMYTEIDTEIQSSNQNVSKLTKYKCEVFINENTGLVNKIKFTKNI